MAVQYQEVNVTLSAATYARLKQGDPFSKRRVAEQAVEAIRVAIYTMYPPRAPEEWKDSSRYQGAERHILLFWYDLVSYLLRRLMGPDDDPGRDANHISDQPAQITLKIPIRLLQWIEKIARSNQSTTPEATVYAIEYGLRVLDSQDASGEGLRSVWRAIFHAIRKRLVKVDR